MNFRTAAVNPTHVGMDRMIITDDHYTNRKPHARGDGPHRDFHNITSRLVNPTHVGMDRRKADP